MIKLFDVADVIRSKNSGPYELTFDIIFKELEMFEKVAAAIAAGKVMTAEIFADLYNIKAESVVGIIAFKPAKAVKITIERPIPSGHLGETDVYGAQQHAPLLGFEFEV
ncbi:MAG: DUF4387 domain-containing protein [Turicibacter sp.]|nr:DUF4387 domain-containing protein [Turicibacter sp.]